LNRRPLDPQARIGGFTRSEGVDRRASHLRNRCLGAGITATIGANLSHGIGHGPVGALVSAWPALALAGSFEDVKDLPRAKLNPYDSLLGDAYIQTDVHAGAQDCSQLIHDGLVSWRSPLVSAHLRDLHDKYRFATHGGTTVVTQC
jgi:hypothetical protein